MEYFFGQNISLSLAEYALILMLFSFLLIFLAFFNSKKKTNSKLDNIQNRLNQISNLINEINSGYGVIDKNLNSSKEGITNINETIRSIQKDIGRKNDENLTEQNINKAVDLAKLGVEIKEISSRTGLSEEQIETLIKFHTEK